MLRPSSIAPLPLTLLDRLLDGPLDFAIQRIEGLQQRAGLRFEWFCRPRQPGLTTQQVFDLLSDDPRSWELDLRIVTEALEWARSTGHALSVNVSPVAISQPRFRHALRSLLGSCSARPWWEVTESWPLADPVEGRRTLDLLREHGHPIAFDDVGEPGRLEEWVDALGVPEIVKVDLSVIQKRPRDLPALVASIHALGSQAVVEGVESNAAFQIARASGADYWQGYYLAMPQQLPSEER